MVRAEPTESPYPSLTEAGERYIEARRLHAEAFLRYKLADPKRTDGVARAMADVEVDLAEAEVNWAIAQGLWQHYAILDGSAPWSEDDAD